MTKGNGQIVLIVDDHPSIVEVLEEILVDMGFQTVGFTSSKQALQAFKAQPDRFDLMITDEDMPEIKGTALASQIKQMRPSLPIIMASGYGGDQIAAGAKAAGIDIFLRKPLTREALASAISKCLRL